MHLHCGVIHLSCPLESSSACCLLQTVPFTMRRHTLILPTSIELLMGEATFKQQLAGFQQQGKILGESNPDYKMVQKIAKRIIGAVEEQRGGGFQKHVPK